MSPRTGRPPSENPRTKPVPVRFSDAEYAELKEAAALIEVPPDKPAVRPSEFIRDAALAAARKTLRAAKRSR